MLKAETRDGVIFIDGVSFHKLSPAKRILVKAVAPFMVVLTRLQSRWIAFKLSRIERRLASNEQKIASNKAQLRAMESQ
jgi:hypothetical protein